MAPTNEDIVDGLRKGDPGSTKIVLGWVASSVKYVVRGSKVSHDDLEDLRSICFDAFYEQVTNGKYRGDGAKSYIAIICRRQFANLLRERYDHPNGSGPDAADIPAESLTSDERALLILRVERLKRALPRLSPQDRSIVLLRQLGHSFRDIGKRLGLSENAARQANWKALRRLLELMDKEKKP